MKKLLVLLVIAAMLTMAVPAALADGPGMCYMHQVIADTGQYGYLTLGQHVTVVLEVAPGYFYSFDAVAQYAEVGGGDNAMILVIDDWYECQMPGDHSTMVQTQTNWSIRTEWGVSRQVESRVQFYGTVGGQNPQPGFGVQSDLDRSITFFGNQSTHRDSSITFGWR